MIARHPENASYRRELAGDLASRGDAYASIGRDAEARDEFREALQTMSALRAQDLANAQYRRDEVALEVKLGSAEADLGRADEALVLLREAHTFNEVALASDPANVLARARVANPEEGLGKVYKVFATKSKSSSEAAGNWQIARSWYQKTHDIWLEFRNQGMTTGDDAAKPDVLAREIARCDEALKKLRLQTDR